MKRTRNSYWLSFTIGLHIHISSFYPPAHFVLCCFHLPLSFLFLNFPYYLLFFQQHCLYVKSSYKSVSLGLIFHNPFLLVSSPAPLKYQLLYLSPVSLPLTTLKKIANSLNPPLHHPQMPLLLFLILSCL